MVTHRQDRATRMAVQVRGCRIILLPRLQLGLLERRPSREKNTTVTRRPWTQLFVFVVLDGLSGVISMFASIYCYGAQNGVYGASNIAAVPQRCAPLFCAICVFLNAIYYSLCLLWKQEQTP